MKLFGNKKISTKNLYKSSEHGWSAKKFHELCDNKGATISLFKIMKEDTKEEACVGGFTNASWSSPKDQIYVQDSSAFLFNLDT
jgi:hypothetical protein